MSPTKYLLGRWRKPQAENKNSPAAIEDSPVDPHEIPLSFRELLIAPVLLACRSYASFTILDISFRTVLPVYLATPINMGGLGLDRHRNHPGIDGVGWHPPASFLRPAAQSAGRKDPLSVYDLALYPHRCSFPHHESRQPRVWNDPLCMVPRRSSDIFVRLRKPCDQ